MGGGKDAKKFVLRPKGGPWIDGSYTGPLADREFCFDAEGSEYCAEGWIYMLRMHINASRDAHLPKAAMVPSESAASTAVGRDSELTNVAYEPTLTKTKK